MSVGPVPDAIRAFATRGVRGDGTLPRQVRVEQTGEMWQHPGARPLRFTAVEEFAVTEVAFTWRARFPIVPLVSVHVRDGYGAGRGRMDASVLGVPVMRRRGPGIALGAGLRYLAELPWVPHALLANRELEWVELHGHSVEVATCVGTARVAVRLELDEAGDVVAARADERPRDGDVPRPWGGVFADYAVVGGVRVPTSAEVSWDLPAGRFVYWRGRVTGLSLRT